jgi:hypothetical protein
MSFYSVLYYKIIHITITWTPPLSAWMHPNPCPHKHCLWLVWTPPSICTDSNIFSRTTYRPSKRSLLSNRTNPTSTRSSSYLSGPQLRLRGSSTLFTRTIYFVWVDGPFPPHRSPTPFAWGLGLPPVHMESLLHLRGSPTPSA